jgi:hypothetical protein
VKKAGEIHIGQEMQRMPRDSGSINLKCGDLKCQGSKGRNEMESINNFGPAKAIGNSEPARSHRVGLNAVWRAILHFERRARSRRFWS